VADNPVGEKSAAGENEVRKPPLAKNPKPAKTKDIDFSPTHFSPTEIRNFSPTRKAPLKLVKPASKGQRGRPRNPDLPPAPGKYFYWTKARNGLKLERREDLKSEDYEYIGFIMPAEWQYLRGQFDESYILRVITAAIRVKRSRATESRRTGTNDN
jgi:hypothetical protein